MKRNCFALLCMLISMCARAGSDLIPNPDSRFFLYRVVLTDKQGTPFSLEQPEKFLSKKALDRRKRQGLAVDSTDLPVSIVYQKRVREAGAEVVGRSKWNNSLLVRGENAQALERLVNLPFVKRSIRVWTSPDSVREHPRRTAFHSEFKKWENMPHSRYGATQNQMEMLNGTMLHKVGLTGNGLTIAVLDGGFMNVDKIPAFSKVRILGTRDFVVPAAYNIYKEVEHGTKVLSTMAVDEPELYAGAAPDASFWLLRCETDETESLAEEDFWACAVEFADSVGADIINSSLGYHYFDDKKTNHCYAELDGESAFISRTASMLAQKGIVLVNSAGNDGMGTWKKINFPADGKDILTVGAVTPERMNAAFSAIGPTADGRVKPDVMAPGSPVSVVTGRGTIVQETGTSFAAPLVTGLVACLWQGLRSKTALQIMELVRQSGDNAATPDNIMGYGVPDFWRAYQKGRSQ
ncbi:MAG: S8 family serine peptidase [Prevotella sp.]|nr:S8 family serine peptidase [Prevotella sp.]